MGDAVSSSPSDRPPPFLISPSPCTAWAAILGLHLSVLHDHLRSVVPEIYGENTGGLSTMMKSAVKKGAGAAARDAAQAALAPFDAFHAQIASA